MKVNIMMIAGLISVLSMQAQANTHNVKCYMQLDTKMRAVQFYSKSTETARELKESLVGLYIVEQDGRTKRFIDKVFECVDQARTFSSSHARELEKATPR